MPTDSNDRTASPEPSDLATDLVEALESSVEVQKELCAEVNNLAGSLDDLCEMIKNKLKLPAIAGRLFGKQAK